MKKLTVNSFLAFSLICISCTVSENDRRIDFALAVIEDNILTTDYTAQVEIIDRSIDENFKENVSSGNEDIVAVIYTAKILERYNGEKLNRLVFTEFVEKSEEFNEFKSGILIVSLCKDKQGKFYLPDIGYELPAKSVLIEKAKEIKILLNNKKLLLHQQEDNYACNY